MLKCCVTALALTAALAAPAWGQTKSPEPGMKADGGQFVTKQSPSHWRASKLIGVNVYGPNDEKIGNISEVLVDRGGTAHSVVVGVGGFLGIGSKDVALPFGALKWVSHEEAARSDRSKAPGTTGSAPDSKTTDAYQGYPHHAVISMSKDQLKSAPEFRYASQEEKPASAPAPTAPRR